MKVVEEKEQLLEKVDKEKLMDFTKNIASEVRLSGSEEELRAFQYVKGKLDEFGLTTNLYLRKAFISLPVSSELTINDHPVPSITHSMAVSTPVEGIRGEMVYVGEGSNEDYQKIETIGKVVLLEGIATPGAVQKAESHGAIAAVFISAAYTHEMIVSTVWGNPTPETIHLYPKIPVVSINYENGNKVKSVLANKNTMPIWLKTKVDTGWRDIPTLEAEIKGEKNPDDFVLFSGHIDSWHYGVMDNGTANAVMVEVARILADTKPLHRSLKLAFWSGHSHGRYAGSARYVDEHWEELFDHCVLHVNIDSVGGKDSVVLTEGNCMAETKNIAQRAIQFITGDVFEGTRYGRSGDQSFWGPGVPSLLMGLSEQKPSTDPAAKAFSQLFGGGKAGGFGWWWHTTEDTIDKINPDYLERDCKIYLSIIHELCMNELLLIIDQRKAVEELKRYIVQYQEKLTNHQCLQTSLRRIEKLEDEVTFIYEKVNSVQLTDDQKQQLNRWIHRLSKGLVRLNYVKGDEFDHDLALGLPPLPLLSDILKLEGTEVGSDQYNLFLTSITRKLNKFNFTLRSLLEKTANIKSTLNL